MSVIARKMFQSLWKRVGVSDAERIAGLTLPRGVTFRTFRYIEDGDPMHTLSIYWPEGHPDDLPVIIDIHGGGWMYGSKEVNRPFDLALASLGFCVVGLSYRLCPQTDLKGMLADIDAACRFAYSKRVELGMNFLQTFLTGDSAGGHLVAVTAALQSSEKLRGMVGVEPLPFTIRAINLNHAVPFIDHSDLHSKGKLLNALGKSEIMRELYGSKLTRDREFARITSDFSQLIASVTSFPPTHIVTSTGDLSFNWQSHATKKVLDQHGYECELWEVANERHVFNVAHMDQPIGIKTNKRIADFFRLHQGG